MNAARPVSPISVLLVEDDPGDVALTRKSMKASKLSNDLHVVDDGVEALAFLRREPPYAGRPGRTSPDNNDPLVRWAGFLPSCPVSGRSSVPHNGTNQCECKVATDLHFKVYHSLARGRVLR
jgi:CheY-like chemotaxis protein